MRSVSTRKHRICIRHYAFYFQTKGENSTPLPVTILFQLSVPTYSLAETSQFILFPFFFPSIKLTNKQTKLSPDKRQTGKQKS